MTPGTSLAWTTRKIRSKDLRYPLRRLSYDLRKRAVDRWFPRPGLSRHAEAGIQEPPGIRPYFLQREAPLWCFRPSDVPAIVARMPGPAKERTVNEAHGITAGRFELFGHGPVDLEPIDWDHAHRGDVVWTRELNRHAIFEQLGFAYHYSSDDRYAHAFARLATSWIEHNANRIGRIGWDTPFQVGRRINSWIWAFFLFLEWEGWSEEERRVYLRSLGLLTEYLYQTLEYHSPGNHILLEAKALALCAETFPEFAGADRWRTRAWEVLDRELEAQICADGVHCERSTMYHRAIAGELTELWLFCERNGLSRAQRLREVVRRMAEFQRWIDLGNGEYPLLGDSRSRDSYYRFSAPAIVAGWDGERVALERGVADHSWWILSDELAAASRSPVLEGPARAFPEGGYYVSRSAGSDVLVWDCGSFGYDANRNHAHADALSVVLSVAGEPLLVDPGVGGPREAIGRPELGEIAELAGRWHELRTTRAHNTVSVDGEDQAVLADRREVWSPPVPRLSLWSTTEEFDVMRGLHDGYSRLPDPVVHDRLILAGRRGFWIIVDVLSGLDVHVIETRFHLASGSTLERCPSGSAFRVRKNVAELVVSFLDAGAEGDVVFHEEERVGELRHGVAERIAAICATRRAALPVMLGTVLALPHLDVTLQSTRADASEVRVEIGDASCRDRVRVRMDGSSSSPGAGALVDIRRFDAELVPIGRWVFGDGEGTWDGDAQDDSMRGATTTRLEPIAPMEER